jgi:hypothetical protein
MPKRLDDILLACLTKGRRLFAHACRLWEPDHKQDLVGFLDDATTNEQTACCFAKCFYGRLRELFLRNGTNNFNQDRHGGPPYRIANNTT